MSGLVFHQPRPIPIASIHEATYNPRFIEPEELAALKASMVEHGVVLHFVVQELADDGLPLVMIGGHQRLRAARELCADNGWPLPENGWGVVLDIPDRKAKQLNIALNKISGDFDPHMLGQVFASMEELSEDEILATGFTDDEIEAMLKLAESDTDALAAQLEQEAEELEQLLPSKPTLTVAFADKEARELAKQKLGELANKFQCDTGKALLRLLTGGGSARRRRAG